MMFQINSGEHPNTKRNGAKRLYPFDSLAVGDWFVVENISKKPSVAAAASKFGREYGFKISVLQTLDGKLLVKRVV